MPSIKWKVVSISGIQVLEAETLRTAPEDSCTKVCMKKKQTHMDIHNEQK